MFKLIDNEWISNDFLLKWEILLPKISSRQFKLGYYYVQGRHCLNVKSAQYQTFYVENKRIQSNRGTV